MVDNKSNSRQGSNYLMSKNVLILNNLVVSHPDCISINLVSEVRNLQRRLRLKTYLWNYVDLMNQDHLFNGKISGFPLTPLIQIISVMDLFFYEEHLMFRQWEHFICI